MPVEYMKLFTGLAVRSRPDALFAFGDNMQRRGHGGQAAACRGHRNAIGVPTKWKPARTEDSYFTDADFKLVFPHIAEPFKVMASFVLVGGTVVLPEDGFGTGLAELPTRAPMVYGAILGLTEMVKWFSENSRGLGRGG